MDYFMGNDDLVSLVDTEIENAELMGYDIENPEVMGGIFKKLFTKIKKEIKYKKRKKAEAASGTRAATTDQPQNFSLNTPFGTGQYTKGSGFSFLKPQTGTGITPQQNTNIMDTVTRNPAILIGGIAIVYLLMQKKSGKK